MELIEAIRSRKSIRGFRPDPVPREVLQEILKTAIRSPSGLNTQPWEFTVVAGEVLDNIRRANVEMLTSGVRPNADITMKPLQGVYRQRQVDVGVQLFQLMGIGREDTQKRAEWTQRGFRFFDVPAVIILSVDRSLDDPRTYMGLGCITQTICLAALNYGLGTCINGMGLMYPEVVRRFTGIPESKLTVICIAVGYPDWDFPANKLESEREPIENVTTWCGI